MPQLTVSDSSPSFISPTVTPKRRNWEEVEEEDGRTHRSMGGRHVGASAHLWGNKAESSAAVKAYQGQLDLGWMTGLQPTTWPAGLPASPRVGSPRDILGHR